MNNKTINYYNKYTKSFIQTTRSLDFTKKKAAVIMAEYNARMNKSTGSFF